MIKSIKEQFIIKKKKKFISLIKNRSVKHLNYSSDKLNTRNPNILKVKEVKTNRKIINLSKNSFYSFCLQLFICLFIYFLYLISIVD